MSTKRTLIITTTGYDDWSRQRFRGVNRNGSYCAVDDRIHTFEEEPEFPIKDEWTVIEVDAQGNQIKQWQ